MNLEILLRMMSYKKASDLFITAGMAPSVKLNGKVVSVTDKPLSSSRARDIVMSVMNDDQRKEFSTQHECNFALNAHGVGRFRVSAFQQRNHTAMVMRRIESHIPSIEQLALPEVLKKLSVKKKGLIIFVGATGSGKSSSLAAMIGYRNKHATGHVISIEDPIEYVHEHNGCIISQREVGIDTDSFDIALKNALRQAPDVIQIGEIRAQDTMETAITISETGHLCLATLHANNANQALDRIINFFPAERHDQLYLDLSMNLVAVIAQQLIPTVDGKGRVVAVEILVNTPVIADHIRKGEVHMLKEFMERARHDGMQTFDQALYDLFKADKISYDEAIRNADSENEFRLMVKLGDNEKMQEFRDAAAGKKGKDSGKGGLSLEDKF